MTVLRLWLAGTAILLAALAVWAFAPVLVFAALVVLEVKAGVGYFAFSSVSYNEL